MSAAMTPSEVRIAIKRCRKIFVMTEFGASVHITKKVALSLVERLEEDGNWTVRGNDDDDYLFLWGS